MDYRYGLWLWTVAMDRGLAASCVAACIPPPRVRSRAHLYYDTFLPCVSKCADPMALVC